MSVKIGEFTDPKGRKHKTIELKEKGSDKYSFSFGLSKARLILNHLEEIRQFVDDNTGGN